MVHLIDIYHVHCTYYTLWISCTCCTSWIIYIPKTLLISKVFGIYCAVQLHPVNLVNPIYPVEHHGYPAVHPGYPAVHPGYPAVHPGYPVQCSLDN